LFGKLEGSLNFWFLTLEGRIILVLKLVLWI
jgi:hypothetical protein